jgi:hypothetical protein
MGAKTRRTMTVDFDTSTDDLWQGDNPAKTLSFVGLRVQRKSETWASHDSARSSGEVR